jgi:microcystin-dependent protein
MALSYVGDPPGTVKQFAGAVVPAGYLLCDGTAVSRAVYPNLFAAISTNYGVGDGASTFNLPDGRGRTMVGMGSHNEVASLANSEGAVLAQRHPSHRHNVTDPGHAHHTAGAFYTYQDEGNGYQYFQTPGNVNTSGPITGGGAGTIGITVGVSPQTGDSIDTGAFLVVQHIIKY